MSYFRSYVDRLNYPYLKNKFKAYSDHIESFSNSSRDYPLVGDRVLVKTANGKTYENALISSIDASKGLVGVCVQPYIPFINKGLYSGVGLSLAISGGYFAPADLKYFSLIGKKESDYCFWGELPLSGGSVKISRQVPYWSLINHENFY